ncbi:hypothetical protein D3C78_1813450 [compost metagenome]
MVCWAMPPMVETIDVINCDCCPSASTPAEAVETCETIRFMVSTVSFTATAPLLAESSVLRETS